MKKVITYGTYDLFHYGHQALLQNAKALGDYLIVGVTSDEFDRDRGKLNVTQTLAERIESVRATGLADMIIVEEYNGQKIADIQKYGVDIFTVGSDWIGKFDYLNQYCHVHYLPRTHGISSTELRGKKYSSLKLGLIGTKHNIERIADECLFVSGIQVGGICAETEDVRQFAEKNHWPCYCVRTELYDNCDAVYLDVPVEERFSSIMEALAHNCHVVCRSPMFLNIAEAESAYRYACEHRLIVFESLKTRYFPAFERLLLLAHSSYVGQVKDMEIHCSQVPNDMKQYYGTAAFEAMYDWGGFGLLPIGEFFGSDYQDCRFYNQRDPDVGTLTRCVFQYPDGVASLKVGKGYKFEGSMTITGDKGYIYVPAPWWKTDYFEIRYEDLRETKKYFFQYVGEGYRYEIKEFVQNIHNNQLNAAHQNHVLFETSVLERFTTQLCEEVK